MAARLNTKLIVILMLSLAIVAGGVIALAVLRSRRNPERHAEAARAYEAQGDWRNAARYYGRAVGVDKGNIGYLRDWADALENVVAEDETQANDDYKYRFNIEYSLVQLRPEDPEFQRAWLDLVFENAIAGRTTWAFLREQAEIAMLDALPDDPRIGVASRYRGLANTRLLETGNLTADERNQIATDLTVALNHDPTDAEVVESLVAWHLYDSTLKRREDADIARSEAIALASDFAQAHPDDPEATLVQLRTGRMTAVLTNQGRDGISVLLPLVDRLEQQVREQDVPWDIVRSAMREIIAIDTTDGVDRALALLETGLDREPDQPQLLSSYASLLFLRGDIESADAAYQRLARLPNLPTSLEAVTLYSLRRGATRELFDLAMLRWQNGDDEAKVTAAAEAEGWNTQYKTMTTATDPVLTYMTGCLALCVGEHDRAASQFETYLSTTQNPSARELKYAALALLRVDASGAAYQRLSEANRKSNGRDAAILFEMARIDFSRGDLDTAADLVAQGLALRGDNEEARRLSDMINAARDDDTTSPQDPAIKAILAARDIARTDEEAALKILHDAVDADPNNVSLLTELARLEYSRPDGQSAALALVQRGLAVAPDNATLRMLDALMNEADLRPVIHDIVDKTPGLSDIERRLGKVDMLSQYGFMEDADALFATAVDAAPNNGEIIERQFQRAIESNDLAGAEQLALRGVELNIDQAEGQTLLGRLHLARNDFAAGARAFQRATETKPYDAKAWRLLAAAYQNLGQYRRAAAAYEESLQRKSDAIDTLRAYSELQFDMADFTGALESIKAARRLAPSDTTLLLRYIELESIYGDRDSAIAYRESMRRRNPGDILNQMNLAGLYELNGDLAASRDVLEAVKTDDPSDALTVVDTWARWLARRGDAASGIKRFEEFFAQPGLDAKTKLETCLMWGTFLNALNRPDEAIARYREGRAFQDTEVREADRALGDHYTLRGELDAAIAVYRDTLKSQSDDEPLWLRIVDVQLAHAAALQDTNPDRANELLAQSQADLDEYAAKFGRSANATLLEAKTSRLAGDLARAEQIYDLAVQESPDYARCYLERARFYLQGMIRDNQPGLVMKFNDDIDRAIELNPRDTLPWLLRAELPRHELERGRRTKEAVRSLRDALSRVLELDSGNIGARIELFREYLVTKEYDEAYALAMGGRDRNPSDARWHDLLGDVTNIRGDDPAVWIAHYQRAFELDPNPGRLSQLATAIGASDPSSGATRALALLDAHEEYRDPAVELVRASLLADSNRVPEALTMMAAMYDAHLAPLPEDVTRWQSTRGWFNELTTMTEPNAVIAWVDELRANQSTDTDIFLEILNAEFVIATNGRARQGVQSAMATDALNRLTSIKTQVSNRAPGDATTTYTTSCGRLLGSLLYARGDYPAAVETWEWVLAVNPTHMESNNNLAYVLVEHFDDASAAMGPATRAADNPRADQTVLDTYGYVLFRNGQATEAETVLRRALDGEKEIAAAHVHLAQVLYELERPDEAVVELDRGRRIATEQNDTKLLETIHQLEQSLAESHIER